MPLGFERLNERVKRPNELINFIRPLPGPDSALSKDFLERIAAISYPIMKANHIAVMALEAYPPNPEFLGRNFNAGEVIQLVLKSNSGAWLPFRHVQMVMMHELAHCKEMNHSKSFWNVRNSYADELKGLWAKGYSGEGLWGNGRGLDGAYLTNELPDASSMPGSLCGGAYRGRRKRKRRGGDKPTLSYAERQQKRILKKFGEGGAAVGGDENTRNLLEKGKKVKGKPRVAGSARGRELRAAAALARFDKIKEETGSEFGDSETESDISWPDSDAEAATDSNGKKVFDLKGQDLVRVCAEEDQDDDDVKREMRELMTGIKDVPGVLQHVNGKLHSTHNDPSGPTEKFRVPPHTLSSDSNFKGNDILADGFGSQSEASESLPKKRNTAKQRPNVVKSPSTKPTDIKKKENWKGASGATSERGATPPRIKQEVIASFSSIFQDKPPIDLSSSSPNALIPEPRKPKSAATKPSAPAPGPEPRQSDVTCPACSFINESGAILCVTCSNVLNPSMMWNHWRCEGVMCKGGPYVNAGDYGQCQLCGAAKPAEKT